MRLLTLDILISNELKFMIEHKPFKEHEKLPSERELAESLHAQRETIRKALKILVQEGWIYTKKRSGYFVCPRRIVKDVYTLTSTTESIKLTGKEMYVKILSFSRIEVDKSLTIKLKLPIGIPLYEIIRLRMVDNEKVSIELTYVPISIAPGLSKNDIENQSLYDILTKKYAINLYKSSQLITADRANQQVANYLEIATEATVVRQEGLIQNPFDETVEFSINFMKMDRFQYGNVRS